MSKSSFDRLNGLNRHELYIKSLDQKAEEMIINQFKKKKKKRSRPSETSIKMFEDCFNPVVNPVKKSPKKKLIKHEPSASINNHLISSGSDSDTNDTIHSSYSRVKHESGASGDHGMIDIKPDVNLLNQQIMASNTNNLPVIQLILMSNGE